MHNLKDDLTLAHKNLDVLCECVVWTRKSVFLLTVQRLGVMEVSWHLAPCSAFLQQPFSAWHPPCQLGFVGLSGVVDVANMVPGRGNLRARGEG